MQHEPFQVQRTGRLLILERGAQWPRWKVPYRSLTASDIIIAQYGTESLGSFEVRVQCSIGECRALGLSPGAAFLSVGAEHGEILLEGRATVVRSVAAALADIGVNRLVLTAPRSWGNNRRERKRAERVVNQKLALFGVSVRVEVDLPHNERWHRSPGELTNAPL